MGTVTTGSQRERAGLGVETEKVDLSAGAAVSPLTFGWLLKFHGDLKVCTRSPMSAAEKLTELFGSRKSLLTAQESKLRSSREVEGKSCTFTFCF